MIPQQQLTEWHSTHCDGRNHVAPIGFEEGEQFDGSHGEALNHGVPGQCMCGHPDYSSCPDWWGNSGQEEPTAATDLSSIIEPDTGGSVRTEVSSWPGGYPNVWLRVEDYASGGSADVVLQLRDVLRLSWSLIKAAVAVRVQRLRLSDRPRRHRSG